MEFLSEPLFQLGGTVVVCVSFIWFLLQKEKIAQVQHAAHQEAISGFGERMDKIVDKFTEECKQQRENCSKEREIDRDNFEQRVTLMIAGLK